MNENRNKPSLTPFSLQCKTCGAPMIFDIINQNYGCSHWGTTEVPKTHQEILFHWAKETHAELKKQKEKLNHYKCTQCGAEVSTIDDSETLSCSFCGSTMVTASFAASEQYPVAIIPFQFTLEDAKQRLTQELNNSLKSLHEKQKKKIRNNLYQLRQVYLPFQLYTGPISAEVSRTSPYNNRTFHLGSFVNQKPVIACNNVENQLIDQVEPFHMEGLRPFEFLYISGHQAKTQDNEYKALQVDYTREINQDLKQALGNKLGSSSISIQVNTEDSGSIPVLLPVFIMKFKEISLSMNGQTGKIGVLMRKKPKKNHAWLVEPALLTLAIFGILLYFYRHNIGGAIGSTAVIGMILFTAYHYNGGSFIYDNILKSRKTYKRENKILIETKESGENATFKQPVFYEKLHSDILEPVELKFFPPRLLFLMLLLGTIVIFLPQILYFISLPFILLTTTKTIDILKPGSLDYSAVWYVIAVALISLMGMTYGRQGLFDRPYIRAYGSNHRFVVAKEQVTSIPSMLSTLLKGIFNFKWLILFFAVALLVAVVGMYL